MCGQGSVLVRVGRDSEGGGGTNFDCCPLLRCITTCTAFAPYQ